jgi:ankyrin repeat protein
MLVDAYPLGIDITDNMGETPVSILKRNGSATCADENGMLILHHACLDDSFPIHAFRLLVEAFPEGINAADNQGRTPSNILNARASQRDANGMLLLHHQACSRSASINLFRLLFKACPESIASTDKRGMLPLHHACMNSGLLSLDIIQKFIHYYPESILFKVSE